MNHVAEPGGDWRAVLFVVGHGGGKAALLLGELLCAFGLCFWIAELPADTANPRHVGANFSRHIWLWFV